MTTRATRPDLGSFLDQVYPVLWDRLGSAFPEFGFERRGETQVATLWPVDLALAAEDKRPDRLMVYRDRPWYLKLHGHEGVGLLEYVAREPRPRGEAFVEAVRRLATIAGVPFPEADPSPAGVQRAQALEARRCALEIVVEACSRALWATGDPVAELSRRFLMEARCFTEAEVRDLGLGLYRSRRDVGAALERAGHDRETIRETGATWQELEGYVVIPWRDTPGRVLTLYGRWHEKKAPDGHPKTIALPGKDTKGVPLYFDRARRSGVEELVVVEGVLDAAMCQARGDARVVATVAAQLSRGQAEALRRHRVVRAIACGDPDGGGDRGNEANVRALLAQGIGALVAPRLPDGLDPDEFVSRDGIEAWRAHVARAVAGPRFLVERALGEAKREDEDAARRAACDRAVLSIADVPAGLDEADAIALISNRTRYPKRDVERQLRTSRARAKRREPLATDREKPVVRVRPELEEVADEAEAALLAADVGVYQRAGALVHVVRDAAGPRIATLPRSRLMTLLAQHAVWVVPKRTPGGELVEARVLPPKAVVDEVLERGTWTFPELEGVLVAPTLRPDGSVLDRPGYDASTRLLYEPAVPFPPVPERPSLADAREALRQVHEPFRHFPFARETDRSAALALVLTVLGRAAFPGPTPLFMVRATVRGSGKQLLAELVSTLALGGPPPTFAAPREDAEWEKKLVTHVRAGDRLTVIDEATHLASPVLSHAITQEHLTARLLGVNENVRGRTPVLVSCGNQTTFAHDLGRRLVPIEIDPKRADPERRRLPDAVAFVRRHRPRLVVAALTALRAYVVAGRPELDLFAVGSFGGWSSLVRSALVWTGLADPAEGQVRICATADVGADDTVALLRAWLEATEDGLTAREVVVRAGAQGVRGPEHPEWRELLLNLDDKQRGELNSRRLGWAFRRLVDRIVGGLVLRRDVGGGHASATWRVERVPGTHPGTPEVPGGSRGCSRTDNSSTETYLPDLYGNSGTFDDAVQDDGARARAQADVGCDRVHPRALVGGPGERGTPRFPEESEHVHYSNGHGSNGNPSGTPREPPREVDPGFPEDPDAGDAREPDD